MKEDTDSLKAKLEQIQNQLNSYKYEQNGKVDNLLQQKKELEKDKKLLRDKIYALENVEITSEERYDNNNCIIIHNKFENMANLDRPFFKFVVFTSKCFFFVNNNFAFRGYHFLPMLYFKSAGILRLAPLSGE